MTWFGDSSFIRLPAACLAAALILFLPACGGGEKAQSDGQRSGTAEQTDSAQTDAEALGRELHKVMDRVMAYRTSHFGAQPPSLTQVGLDSLTPVFARWVERTPDGPVVTVQFRRMGGHLVSSCTGTSLTLEDATIEGEFEVTCRMAGGQARTFKIGPPPPPPLPPEE